MIRQTKKLFLGLFSLVAIFVIAGCGQNQASDQNANNAQQAQAQQEQKDPNNISGEWESINEIDSIQKDFGIYDLNHYTFKKFIEAFKDFKMNLSVDGTNVKLSYQYDLNKFAKAYYAISTFKNEKTEEEFLTWQKEGLAEFGKNYKKYKVSMDTSTGIYSYEATGTVDESAKTVTFDEGFTIIHSFPLTSAAKDHWFDSATYNYEVKDGILTIYADMKTKDNLPIHFELNFKRVPSAEKK